MATPPDPAKPGRPTPKKAPPRPAANLGATTAPGEPAPDLGATTAPDPPAADLGATTAPEEPGADLGATTAPSNSAASLGTTSAFQETHASPGRQRPPASGGPAKPAPKLTTLGDFRMVKKLGAGGMGEVYLGHQISLDRVAAVKVMAKHLASNKTFVERFYREARLMAKLDHQNIIRSYGVGEAHGYHYLAMEFVDGGSLQDWLKRQEKLSVPDAVHVILACARALEHAHQHTVVHRDIKPDNVLLTRAGLVKLADLGLAKATEEDVGLTQSGVGAGTPLYMAPEQAASAKYADARSDIYSLGCMLYCLLTGSPPFKGETTLELLKAKEAGTYPSVRRVNPEVPPRLDLIVDKMCARKPETRYQTCTELIKDLDSLAVASAALSFFTTPGQQPAAKSTSASPTQPPASGKTVAPASSPANVEGADLWYITYLDEDGEKVSKRLTTQRIRTLIQAGQLNEDALASHSRTDKKRPLISFKEFDHLLRAKLAKATADKKGTTGKFQDLYKDIAAQERFQRRWGWLKKAWKPIKDWGLFLVWMAVIAAVLYGGYRILSQYI